MMRSFSSQRRALLGAALAAAPCSATAATPAAATPAAAQRKPTPAAPVAPPSARLTFELRYGALRGEGILDWRNDGTRYHATLEALALGMRFFSQESNGGFDDQGLAPSNFVERRRSRTEHSAEFRRDAGVIAFAGKSATYPLVAGAQDRVSWLLQMTARAAAQPAPWAAGTKISMFVVGARGEGDTWEFQVQGPRRVMLPIGRADRALYLVARRPSDPDQAIEVWLDPARRWLPVRLRQRESGGDTYDFLLSGLVS